MDIQALEIRHSPVGGLEICLTKLPFSLHRVAAWRRRLFEILDPQPTKVKS